MFSKQVVCNDIRSVKLYHQTNCTSFVRQNVIDEEEGRCISFRLSCTYNKKTNVYSVHSGLIYCHRYIGPLKNSKQNCNDPAFVKHFTETHLKAARKYELKKHNLEVEA